MKDTTLELKKQILVLAGFRALDEPLGATDAQRSLGHTVAHIYSDLSLKPSVAALIAMELACYIDDIGMFDEVSTQALDPVLPQGDTVQKVFVASATQCGKTTQDLVRPYLNKFQMEASPGLAPVETGDPEMVALEIMAQAVKRLSPDALKRALDYLNARFGGHG